MERFERRVAGVTDAASGIARALPIASPVAAVIGAQGERSPERADAEGSRAELTRRR